MRTRHALLAMVLALAAISCAPAVVTWQMDFGPGLPMYTELPRPDELPRPRALPPIAPLYLEPLGPAPAQVPDTIKAFPECTGFGCLALNPCRSLPMVIHKVTNLATWHGTPGSFTNILKDATSDTTFDIIGFALSGVTDGLGSTGQSSGLNTDCTYVAGQHATGGFALRADSTTGGGPLKVGDGSSNNPANHAVIRGFHVFRDTCRGGSGCSQQSAITVANGTNLVFAEMSTYGGIDQTWGIYGGRNSPTGLDGMTLWRVNVIPVWAEPTAMIIANNLGDQNGNVNRVDLVDVFFSHMRHRRARYFAMTDTPTNGTIRNVTQVNNYSYMWQTRNTEIAADVHLDYRRNAFRAVTGRSDIDDIITLRGAVSTTPDIVPWNLHIRANFVFGQLEDTTATGDQAFKDGFIKNNDQPCGTDCNGHYRSTQHPAPYFNYEETTATAAYDRIAVQGLTGAKWYLAADGIRVSYETNWDLAYRTDARDSLQTMLDSGSPPRTMFDHPLGDWPSLSPASTCADDDNDLMCNAYELIVTNGASTTSWPPNAITVSGYTTVEHFLNTTHPDCGYAEIAAGNGSWNRTPATGTNCPAGGSTTTYANGKDVHLGSWKIDTIPDPEGAVPVRTVHADSVVFSSQTAGYSLREVSVTELMLVTQGTLAVPPSYVRLDSAQVDSVCAANGISGCPATIRNMDPGR